MNTLPVKCMVCGALGDMPYDSETAPDMAAIIGRLWRCEAHQRKVSYNFKPKHVEAKPKPAARLPYQE